MTQSREDRAGGGEPRVDGQPLGEVLEEFRPRLLRMLELRLDPRLRPRVDESDVLQEAYVEVARRLGDHASTPHVPFFLWVRQIARQKLVDLQRRHMRAARRDVRRELRSQGTESSRALARALTRHAPSPSGAAVRAEDGERLREALDGMAEMDREILLLRHFEELALQDCAQVLEISSSAAKMRHVRALERLGAILQRRERRRG